MPLKTTEHLNVLLIDDDEEDYFIMAKLISEIQQYKCSITWRYSYNTALAELSTLQYHIAFVDYRLGAKTGVELIEEAILSGVYIPFILTTGCSSPSVNTSLDKNGKYTHLLKMQLTSASLEYAIKSALADYVNHDAS